MTVAYAGPNADLVSAVIELAENGFTPATAPNDTLSGVEFTTDLERAATSCFDQEHEPLIGVSARGCERLQATADDFAEGITWQDIRSNMVAAEIWTAEWYDWSREQGESIDSLQDISDSWESIADRLCRAGSEIDRDDAESVGEDIAAILSYVAQARAFRSAEATFHETLFGFCKLGFWPCGFVGTWPDDGHYLLWHRK